MNIQVYKDDKGEWRWRAVAHNGNIMAESGEAYRRRSGAVKAAQRVQQLFPKAGIVEQLA